MCLKEIPITFQQIYKIQLIWFCNVVFVENTATKVVHIHWDTWIMITLNIFSVCSSHSLSVITCCVHENRGWLRVGQRGHVVLVPKGLHSKVGIEFEKPYCGPDGYNNGMEELQRTEIEWCYCMLPSFKPHQIFALQPLKVTGVFFEN